MKKKLFSVMAALCAAALCTALFAACGGGGEGDPDHQQGGGTTSTSYTISVTASDEYTLTPSKTSAEAGEEITVTAESKNPDKYITGVTFNGTACGEEEEGYSFTMPAANVTLAATTEAYAEKLSEGFLSFTGLVPDTIAAFENTFSAEDKFEFTFNGEEIQVEEDEVQLFSSNQAVIPDSALSVSLNETSPGSTGKSGGALSVAVNDIAPGTAYITMTIEDHTTHRGATVVKKLNVVESGVIEIPTMEVTLTFNLSGIWSDMEKHADTVKIFLNDADKIYGAKNDDTGFEQSYTMSSVGDPSKITIMMENFAAGHTYSVGIQFLEGNKHYVFAKMNYLTNAKGSFDGNWLDLSAVEAVEFGPLVAAGIN